MLCCAFLTFIGSVPRWSMFGVGRPARPAVKQSHGRVRYCAHGSATLYSARMRCCHFDEETGGAVLGAGVCFLPGVSVERLGLEISPTWQPKFAARFLRRDGAGRRGPFARPGSWTPSADQLGQARNARRRVHVAGHARRAAGWSTARGDPTPWPSGTPMPPAKSSPQQ